MEELKLLGAWLSPFSYRVEWALKLKGLNYIYIQEDITNKSDLLLHYNPVHKKVPVLVHGGKPIAESIIILEYIDEMWPENPMLPKDAYERSIAQFWAKFGDEKCSAIWSFFRSVGEEQENAMKESKEALRILEERGLGEKFFGGDSMGFTDIVLGWIPHWMEVIEDIFNVKMIETHTFPHSHAWAENFMKISVIKESLPPLGEMVAYFKLRREHFLPSSPCD